MNFLGDRSKNYFDMGQSRVMQNPGEGVFSSLRLLYYRYTLMTGVYMLDRVERWTLHFLVFLGAVFLLKYAFGFYLAARSSGYL